jgi:2-keto-4-pentenoate hydratase
MANIGELADRLATARRSRKYLTFEAAMACPSVVEAYRVQAMVAEKLGETVAGWKVGIWIDGSAMAAPIFTSDLRVEGEHFELSGDLSSVKVEAELGLRLGRDLPPRSGGSYSREDILDAVAEAFCGIELVATRFRNEGDADFPTKLADNFAHAGYVRGSGIASLAGIDVMQLRCKVLQDGVSVRDQQGAHPFGDPLAPVIAWASAQCDHLGGLRAGQFLTTGTLIDPFDLRETAGLRAELEGIGNASADVAWNG